MIDGHHSGTPPLRVAVLAVVLCLALPACGGDDSPGGDAGGATRDPGAGSAATAGSGSVGSGPGSGGDECPEPVGALEGFDSVVVSGAVDGEDATWCLLLADDPGRRRQGLMGVTDLDPFDGMLFAYEGTSTGGYWMRDTPLPLSIAWISPDGEVVGTADMEPCPDAGASCPTYGPGDAAYRWALEVPQGGLGALGLDPGVRLDVAAWPLGTD